ncbi:MAG: DUF2232 domain-containing protein [Hyphomicrobiales bacterium]|nr:DUF2232 domain-containing protein [Hyphomicrobiales bacterium]
MTQIALVGLGAGAAAALLFASVTSGSPIAIALFYLAPLPILIAALGWSHLAGLIAAATATAVVVILAGKLFIAVPVISFGAWWLGYLALLARPVPNGGAQTLEWYPIGRLVLWAAVIGALIVAAAIPNFGTDQQSIQDTLRKSYERWFRDKSTVDLLVVAVPPAAGVFSTLTNVFNLWLAAWVVKTSGRMTRPWPDLSAMTFSPSAAGGLAAAVAGSLLPDLPGLLLGVLAASLLMAFAVLGFSVLHTVTRGLNSRPFVLGATYAATFIYGLPVLAMAALGLAETVIDVRSRIAARRRGPPDNRT